MFDFIILGRHHLFPVSTGETIFPVLFHQTPVFLVLMRFSHLVIAGRHDKFLFGFLFRHHLFRGLGGLLRYRHLLICFLLGLFVRLGNFLLRLLNSSFLLLF